MGNHQSVLVIIQQLVEFRVEMEKPQGRVFIAVHGQIVDIHITEDGIGVQITKGNDVLAECMTDA